MVRTDTAEAAILTRIAAKKGQSLWKDAWRRLRRNRFAMGGLVVVILMSLTAIAADWIIPFEPDYGQPWLQAQRPGFTHPAVLAETRFDLGEAPMVPERIPGAVADLIGENGLIEYRVHEIEEVEYRLKIRRGKVQQIGRLAGAVRVDRLEVSGEREYVQVLGGKGPKGDKLRNLTIERKKPLPPGLESEGRVLLLRVSRPRTPEPETIEVRIEGGRTTSITRNGKEVGQLRLEGRSVLRVTKDGKERRLTHLLGTDLAGRDVLSRVIYGGRISLLVGAVATIVSVLVGVIYGAVAGYLAQQPMTVWGVVSAILAIVGAGAVFALAGGFLVSVLFAVVFFVVFLGAMGKLSPLIPGLFPHRRLTATGEFMMRIVDIMYALPFMFLVILLMISYGRDIITLFIALGLVQWLTMARIVRGQVLSLKEKEFVEAAHMCGANHFGILFRHLVPNTLGVVIVYATLTVPAVILQESFLAFIGLTVEFQGRTLDSWGSLVNLGRQELTSTGGNWWVLVFPSIAMALTLFSLNFLGDGLRDALDPKLKGRT